MRHDTTLDNALWQFACSIYSQPQVANTLLWLQDEHALNINMVILMIWLDRQGYEINEVQLNQCLNAIEDVENELIAPLRQLRKKIKTLIPQHSRLYQEAKQLELGLEQMAIARLFSQASAFLPNSQETFSPHHNLSLYVLSASHVSLDQLHALWAIDR